MKDGKNCPGLHCRCMYPDRCPHFHHSDHDCPHRMNHNPEHICTTECVCPVHNTQLLFNPDSGDHACRDIMCIYAHGFQKLNRVIRTEVKKRIDLDPRGPFERAGSVFNLAGLYQLLAGWKDMDGRPSNSSDELVVYLSRAFEAVEKEILAKLGPEGLEHMKEMMSP